MPYFFTKKFDWLLAVIIFLLALLPRVFLFHTEFWRTPDGIEYINVARNFNNGDGLTKSLKMSFYDESPVITSAVQGQPLLTSVIFALLLKVQDDVYLLQAFGLFMMCCNSILFFLLARHFYSPALSFLAGLFFALNPNILITNRLILSEPIFIACVLSFFLVFYCMKRTMVRYILLGVIAGLAYLTRLEGMYLLVTLLLLEARKNKLIVVSIIAFGITAFPYFLLNYQVNHNPFYTFTSYHFRVRQFSDYMWSGYGKSVPSVWDFLIQNSLWVLSAITRLIVENIKSIVGVGFLGLLTSVYIFRFKESIRAYKPLLLFALFDFLTFSIIWSQFTEPERHFMPLFPMVLLPVFAVWKKVSLRKFVSVVFCLTIVIYLVFDVHRIVWARTVEPHMDNWGMEDKKVVYMWIKEHTNKHDIIASINPPMTYLFTERPVILLPSGLSRQQLKQFVKQYEVRYIIAQESDAAVFEKGTLVFKDKGQMVYSFAN